MDYSPIAGILLCYGNSGCPVIISHMLRLSKGSPKTPIPLLTAPRNMQFPCSQTYGDPSPAPEGQ